jgi:prephenate dehydrogenase
MAVVRHVTIVGLGLIGGSLGMAIRRHGVAGRVVGVSRKRATLAMATRRGAIDAGSADLASAVAEADLVVLATPVDRIVQDGLAAAAAMRPGAVLTDVGSTKQQIVAGLRRTGVAFVGAHPLAGSEQRGIAAARPDLFDGAVCVITPTAQTPASAQRLVAGLWRSLGCRVTTMTPAAHDRALAAVSHLPHALAFSLIAATDPSLRRLAPRSFLDATRVAKSDPDLWDDIFVSNEAAVQQAMDRFERSWQTFRALVRRGDRRGLRAWLAAAQRARERMDGH